MTYEQALELITTKLQENRDSLNESLVNKGNSFLWAALALIGYYYCQKTGDKNAMEASDFWPFGDFEPNEDPKENLAKACQMLIFELQKINCEMENIEGKLPSAE